ncbi:hypothetical protein [Nevskia sp.]|uniref:glycoside hydrolase family 19 protein n=1 Tax=Nevskia sp. TaxID=1929292 RepID=UPI0025F384D9|nr:hypothetical protein [Nevskia sp.]
MRQGPPKAGLSRCIRICETLIDSRARDDARMTPEQLQAFCPAALSFHVQLVSAMTTFRINTPIRQAMFLAQIAHESQGFTRLEENLNYSAEKLLELWPSRFSPAEAKAYARQPERIANRAYANRLGNADEASGNGWRYRGRGLIQITGLRNYSECSKALSPRRNFLVQNPEALLRPIYAAESAGWYWNHAGCSNSADDGDFIGCTRRINTRLIGMPDRLVWFGKAKQLLSIPD